MAAVDLAAAEQGLRRRDNARVDSGRGGAGRLADSALFDRETAHVLGSFGDNRYEFCARAHVFGGHVRRAEAVDHVAEVEHRVTLPRVCEHHTDREVDHGLHRPG